MAGHLGNWSDSNWIMSATHVLPMSMKNLRGQASDTDAEVATPGPSAALSVAASHGTACTPRRFEEIPTSSGKAPKDCRGRRVGARHKDLDPRSLG